MTRMSADRGLEENVRLYSLMFAYWGKNVESPARGHRGRSRIAQLQIADWRMRIADWAAWTALPGARSAGRANSSRSGGHLAISGVSNAVLSPRLQRIESGPKRPRHLAELRGQDPRAMPAGLPLDFIHQTLQGIEQSLARARDAAADDDRFRIQDIDEGTDGAGELSQ